MVRISKVIVVILSAFCLISLGRAEEPTFEYSEEEAKLYRMPIKQITPKDGIWTGHVIAYGHYIKPPYKFEIRDDTLLFVNNVQIIPPLISTISLKRKEEMEEESHEAGKVAKQYNDRLDAILNMAREVYREITLRKDRNAAMDSICKLFKNDTLLKKIIIDVRVYPTSESDATMSIKLNLPGFGVTPFILQFYLYPPDTGKPIYKDKKEEIAARKASLQDDIGEFSNDLNKGKILLVSSFRGWPFTVEKLNKKTKDIIDILSSSKSAGEKRDILNSLKLIDPEKEILYNYESTEWPPSESLKFRDK